MDLGEEESCRQLFLLLRESRAEAVIHLAFVLDPVRAGVLDLDRMWQINVAGTARVMEAITEANHEETMVRKFIFPSSVSVYGSDLTGAGDRGTSAGRPHAALCDAQDGMRQSGAAAGARAARVQRVYAASAYFCRGQRGELHGGRFSGHAGRASDRAASMRSRGKRLPCLLPRGRRYLENRIQFVHVDDMARLITRILRRRSPKRKD